MEKFTFIVEFKDGRQQKINGVKEYLLTDVAGTPLLKVKKVKCIFFSTGTKCSIADGRMIYLNEREIK